MFPTVLKNAPETNTHFYSAMHRKMPLKLRKCYLNSFKSFNYILFKQIDVCLCIIFQRNNEFNSLCLNSRFSPRILFHMSVWPTDGTILESENNMQ